jgi:poly-gamma-glutamate system protein
VGWLLAAATLVPGAAGLLPPVTTGSSRAILHPPPALAARAAEAAAAMRRAEAFLASERVRLGVPADAEARPDPSGLLGGEVTPLMTTLGSLEAKRLATNPAWASALVLRLDDAGVTRGDVIAASFSGSFPGLNLALVVAARSLGADVIAVSSVTASTWGANQKGFTWPEMEVRLVEAGLITRATVAVTAGGGADAALDLEPEGRDMAVAIRDEAARRLEAPVLAPRSFSEAVELRLSSYRKAAKGRRLALYANVGGADASLGRSAAVLRLRSGFLPAVRFGPREDEGVMSRLAARGVPILMLLNVRDLALRWNVR